jgi:predicted PurR-regulated permease PerM
MKNDWPITKILAAAVLLLLALIILYSLSEFIDAVLGAVMFYVLCRPLMLFLIEKKNWSRTTASWVILLLVLIYVIVPLIIISNVFFPRILALLDDQSAVTSMLTNVENIVQKKTGVDIFDESTISKLRNALVELLTGFLGESLNILADLGVLILFLYFFLKNVGQMEMVFISFLPLTKNNIDAFGKELVAQTYSNVLGAPILAMVQGLVASVGYFLFGVPDPWFWGILTGIFSFIPVVGSALVWVPAALFLLGNEQTISGTLLLIYGFLIISMVDNVFRFAFQKRFADVHPLNTVMGVILGIKLFGVPGILFGPLLISYFIILLKIYKEDFIIEEKP